MTSLMRPDRPTTIWAWRHPRCDAAAGRCIGRTDLQVDPRRAKRLAHRIRATQRRERLPKEVRTSPLARARDVGRWLRRWGWRHRVDERLTELDFGAWDGLPWSAIAVEEVARWESDFMDRAPGGGESLRSLMRRVRDFAEAHRGPVIVVGHAGWLQALTWPADLGDPTPGRWPAPPRHGQRVRWPAY